MKSSSVFTWSRIGFIGYFLFTAWTLYFHPYTSSALAGEWVLYLLLIYILSERIYFLFLPRRIDLSFAFPILLAIYTLNLSTLLLGGQVEHYLLNRAEHFASFVLLTYVIWVSFTQYFAKELWKHHPYYTAVTVLAFASLLGVINELIELLLDSLLGTHLIGPNLDTSLDLFMNTLGSILLIGTNLILKAGDDHTQSST